VSDAQDDARVPRRRLLVGLTAGLGVALGSGVTYAADRPSSDGTPGAPTPGEQLMEEHGVLKRTLLVYRALSERAADNRRVPTAVLHGAATLIHDYIESFHEALEERYVFPALQRAGVLVSTVDTLLIQHGVGRQITQDLIALAARPRLDEAQQRSAIQRIDAFVRMYEPHEAREDTVVFPAYRNVTGNHNLARMAEQFAALQTKQFGRNGFADAVDAVAGLEAKLGIADLSMFTPTIH
jgi:hemerythrin-like domain-containing protein